MTSPCRLYQLFVPSISKNSSTSQAGLDGLTVRSSCSLKFSSKVVIQPQSVWGQWSCVRISHSHLMKGALTPRERRLGTNANRMTLKNWFASGFSLGKDVGVLFITCLLLKTESHTAPHTNSPTACPHLSSAMTMDTSGTGSMSLKALTKSCIRK